MPARLSTGLPTLALLTRLPGLAETDPTKAAHPGRSAQTAATLFPGSAGLRPTALLTLLALLP